MPRKSTQKPGWHSLSAIAKKRKAELNYFEKHPERFPEELRDDPLAAMQWRREQKRKQRKYAKQE